MKALTKWTPFRELEDMHNRLANALGKPFFGPEYGLKESLTTSEWAPAVDITEDEKEFLIKAELPEVKKDDIKVSVEDGVLTISGERKFEKEEKNKRYHRVERSYGSFLRSFTLPEDVSPDKVKADFKDGLLTLHLPKSARTPSKAMQVAVE